MSSATSSRNFFAPLRFTKQITPLLAVHQLSTRVGYFLFTNTLSSKALLPLALITIAICDNNNAQKISVASTLNYDSLNIEAELFMSTVGSDTTFINV